jgi:hypothetical protein
VPVLPNSTKNRGRPSSSISRYEAKQSLFYLFEEDAASVRGTPWARLGSPVEVAIRLHGLVHLIHCRAVRFLVSPSSFKRCLAIKAGVFARSGVGSLTALFLCIQQLKFCALKNLSNCAAIHNRHAASLRVKIHSNQRGVGIKCGMSTGTVCVGSSCRIGCSSALGGINGGGLSGINIRLRTIESMRTCHLSTNATKTDTAI